MVNHPMAGAYTTTYDGKRVRIAVDPKRWDALMLDLTRRARRAKAKKATIGAGAVTLVHLDPCGGVFRTENEGSPRAWCSLCGARGPVGETHR